MVKIIPSNFIKLDELLKPTKNEQNLIKKFEELLADETCYLLIKIAPATGIKADLCLIHQEWGIFFIFTRENLLNGKEAVDTNYSIHGFLMSSILRRFETHRQLLDDRNQNKIPVGFLYYFPELNNTEVKKSLFSTKNCLFGNELIHIDKDRFIDKLSNSIIYQPSEFLGITPDDLNALHYAIVPEYRLPKFNIKKNYNEIEDSGLNINSTIDVKLSARDTLKFKALSLTDSQINTINKMKKGYELILSGAGTGKTVILTGRAFRTAKLFDKKNILLTCYNKSLSEYMELYLDTAGMKSRNLTCKTFHAFCRFLLESNHIVLPNRYQYNSYDEYFNELFERTYFHLQSGNIKQRYFAIFIDEIQDFETEWIQLLYSLLEDKNDFIFNICGDKTQDVRRIISEKGAPWINNRLPEFEDKKKYLKTNYRSTTAINKYIEYFNELAKKKLTLVNSTLKEEKDIFLESKKTLKKGKSKIPRYIVADDYEEEIDCVIESIRELHEEREVSYSDIGIVFPFKKINKYSHVYSPYYFLMKALDENNIAHTSLVDKEDSFEGFHNRTGVVVSTINSAKGLDFRGLILFGTSALFPKKASLNMNSEDKIRFNSNVKLLYTAITRAEEYLRIILLENDLKSVYTNILTEPIDKLINENKRRKCRGHIKG